MEKRKRNILIVCGCVVLAAAVLAWAVVPGLLGRRTQKRPPSSHAAMQGAGQRVGNGTVGFFTLPGSWSDETSGASERSQTWAYEDGLGTVLLSAAPLSGMTVEDWAQAAWDSLDQMGYANVVLEDDVFDGRPCRRVSGTHSGLGTVNWVFAGEDGTHLVAVEAPDDYFEDLAWQVSETFSLKK